MHNTIAKKPNHNILVIAVRQNSMARGHLGLPTGGSFRDKRRTPKVAQRAMLKEMDRG